MKIFISSKIPESGVSILKKAGHEVDVWGQACEITYEELIDRCSKVDALICMLSDRIDRAFLSKNSHLKCIATYAVGHNNIDSNYAASLSIPISNTPDVLTDATANLTWGLILGVARKINPSYQSIKENKWKGWEPLGFIGRPLTNQTIGIFGMGAIGQAVAKRASQGFGMKVLYTSRTAKNHLDENIYGQQVSFEKLITSADIISAHAPLTPKTEGIFNKDVFNKMKPTAIFVNTARGLLHNEADLYNALALKKIWAAALDVTNPEPMKSSSPLLKLDNFLVTPHTGSAECDTREEMSRICAMNILAALEGKKLLTPIL